MNIIFKFLCICFFMSCSLNAMRTKMEVDRELIKAVESNSIYNLDVVFERKKINFLQWRELFILSLQKKNYKSALYLFKSFEQVLTLSNTI